MNSIFGTDLGELAEQTRRMQESMARARERMGQLTATGDDGSRAVTATVGGDGKLLGLRIDPTVVDPARPTELSEMIVAATNNALDALHDLHAESIGVVTDHIDGILEGLDENLYGPDRRP